jgi:pimeloyl-ACP methyl ester carboxylesterase
MANVTTSSSLSFTDEGQGLPLVLLHGFPLDRRMWDAQVAELSAHWRVIAPDLRGFGTSRWQAPFSIPDLAQDVHTMLTQLAALPCVLAGLSMGGYVALAFARKYHQDLRGLILVDTKAEGDTSEQREGRAKMIDLVQKQGSKAVADQMVPKLVAEDVPRMRPAVAAAVRTLAEACPPKTIEYALEAMRDRPDQSPHLGSIKVPTLIIVGDADAITPVPVSQKMQQGIAGSELVVIKGSGHMSTMEQPAQVSQAMARFMRGLS